MKDLREFALETKDDKVAFLPGEIVRGELYLCLEEPVEIKCIKVFLVGEGEGAWIRQSTPLTTSSRRNDKEVIKRHYLINIGLIAFGYKEEDKTQTETHESGRYVYEFEFDLPSLLPPTFRSPGDKDLGFARYFLKAVMSRPKKHDREIRQRIVINELLDPERPELFFQPGKFEEKNVKSLCMPSGTISLESYLNKANYTQGDKILINALAENKSSKVMKELYAVLIRRVHNKSRYGTTTYTTEETRINGARIPANERLEWKEHPLTVPAVGPTITGNNDIRVDYIVRVGMYEDLGSELHLDLPVVIGTVGTREEIDLENAQEEEESQYKLMDTKREKYGLILIKAKDRENYRNALESKRFQDGGKELKPYNENINISQENYDLDSSLDDSIILKSYDDNINQNTRKKGGEILRSNSAPLQRGRVENKNAKNKSDDKKKGFSPRYGIVTKSKDNTVRSGKENVPGTKAKDSMLKKNEKEKAKDKSKPNIKTSGRRSAEPQEELRQKQSSDPMSGPIKRRHISKSQETISSQKDPMSGNRSRRESFGGSERELNNNEVDFMGSKGKLGEAAIPLSGSFDSFEQKKSSQSSLKGSRKLDTHTPRAKTPTELRSSITKDGDVSRSKNNLQKDSTSFTEDREKPLFDSKNASESGRQSQERIRKKWDETAPVGILKKSKESLKRDSDESSSKQHKGSDGKIRDATRRDQDEIIRPSTAVLDTSVDDSFDRLDKTDHSKPQTSKNNTKANADNGDHKDSGRKQTGDHQNDGNDNGTVEVSGKKPENEKNKEKDSEYPEDVDDNDDPFYKKGLDKIKGGFRSLWGGKNDDAKDDGVVSNETSEKNLSIDEQDVIKKKLKANEERGRNEGEKKDPLNRTRGKLGDTKPRKLSEVKRDEALKKKSDQQRVNENTTIACPGETFQPIKASEKTDRNETKEKSDVKVIPFNERRDKVAESTVEKSAIREKILADKSQAKKPIGVSKHDANFVPEKTNQTIGTGRDDRKDSTGQRLEKQSAGREAADKAKIYKDTGDQVKGSGRDIGNKEGLSKKDGITDDKPQNESESRKNEANSASMKDKGEWKDKEREKPSLKRTGDERENKDETDKGKHPDERLPERLNITEETPGRKEVDAKDKYPNKTKDEKKLSRDENVNKDKQDSRVKNFTTDEEDRTKKRKNFTTDEEDRTKKRSVSESDGEKNQNETFFEKADRKFKEIFKSPRSNENENERRDSLGRRRSFKDFFKSSKKADDEGESAISNASGPQIKDDSTKKVDNNKDRGNSEVRKPGESVKTSSKYQGESGKEKPRDSRDQGSSHPMRRERTADSRDGLTPKQPHDNIGPSLEASHDDEYYDALKSPVSDETHPDERHKQNEKAIQPSIITFHDDSRDEESYLEEFEKLEKQLKDDNEGVKNKSKMNEKEIPEENEYSPMSPIHEETDEAYSPRKGREDEPSPSKKRKFTEKLQQKREMRPLIRQDESDSEKIEGDSSFIEKDTSKEGGKINVTFSSDDDLLDKSGDVTIEELRHDTGKQDKDTGNQFLNEEDKGEEEQRRSKSPWQAVEKFGKWLFGIKEDEKNEETGNQPEKSSKEDKTAENKNKMDATKSKPLEKRDSGKKPAQHKSGSSASKQPGKKPGSNVTTAGKTGAKPYNTTTRPASAGQKQGSPGTRSASSRARPLSATATRSTSTGASPSPKTKRATTSMNKTEQGNKTMKNQSPNTVPKQKSSPPTKRTLTNIKKSPKELRKNDPLTGVTGKQKEQGLTGEKDTVNKLPSKVAGKPDSKESPSTRKKKQFTKNNFDSPKSSPSLPKRSPKSKRSTDVTDGPQDPYLSDDSLEQLETDQKPVQKKSTERSPKRKIPQLAKEASKSSSTSDVNKTPYDSLTSTPKKSASPKSKQSPLVSDQIPTAMQNVRKDSASSDDSFYSASEYDEDNVKKDDDKQRRDDMTQTQIKSPNRRIPEYKKRKDSRGTRKEQKTHDERGKPRTSTSTLEERQSKLTKSPSFENIEQDIVEPERIPERRHTGERGEDDEGYGTISRNQSKKQGKDDTRTFAPSENQQKNTDDSSEKSTPQKRKLKKKECEKPSVEERQGRSAPSWRDSLRRSEAGSRSPIKRPAWNDSVKIVDPAPRDRSLDSSSPGVTRKTSATRKSTERIGGLSRSISSPVVNRKGRDSSSEKPISQSPSRDKLPNKSSPKSPGLTRKSSIKIKRSASDSRSPVVVRKRESDGSKTSSIPRSSDEKYDKNDEVRDDIENTGKLSPANQYSEAKKTKPNRTDSKSDNKQNFDRENEWKEGKEMKRQNYINDVDLKPRHDKNKGDLSAEENRKPTSNQNDDTTISDDVFYESDKTPEQLQLPPTPPVRHHKTTDLSSRYPLEGTSDLEGHDDETPETIVSYDHTTHQFVYAERSRSASPSKEHRFRSSENLPTNYEHPHFDNNRAKSHEELSTRHPKKPSRTRSSDKNINNLKDDIDYGDENLKVAKSKRNKHDDTEVSEKKSSLRGQSYIDHSYETNSRDQRWLTNEADHPSNRKQEKELPKDKDKQRKPDFSSDKGDVFQEQIDGRRGDPGSRRKDVGSNKLDKKDSFKKKQDRDWEQRPIKRDPLRTKSTSNERLADNYNSNDSRGETRSSAGDYGSRVTPPERSVKSPDTLDKKLKTNEKEREEEKNRRTSDSRTEKNQKVGRSTERIPDENINDKETVSATEKEQPDQETKKQKSILKQRKEEKSREIYPGVYYKPTGNEMQSPIPYEHVKNKLLKETVAEVTDEDMSERSSIKSDTDNSLKLPSPPTTENLSVNKSSGEKLPITDQKRPTKTVGKDDNAIVLSVNKNLQKRSPRATSVTPTRDLTKPKLYSPHDYKEDYDDDPTYHPTPRPDSSVSRPRSRASSRDEVESMYTRERRADDRQRTRSEEPRMANYDRDGIKPYEQTSQRKYSDGSVSRPMSSGQSSPSKYTEGNIHVTSRGPILPYVGYIERKDEEREGRGSLKDLRLPQPPPANNIDTVELKIKPSNKTNDKKLRLPEAPTKKTPDVKTAPLILPEIKAEPTVIEKPIAFEIKFDENTKPRPKPKEQPKPSYTEKRSKEPYRARSISPNTKSKPQVYRSRSLSPNKDGYLIKTRAIKPASYQQPSSHPKQTYSAKSQAMKDTGSRKSGRKTPTKGNSRPQSPNKKTSPSGSYIELGLANPPTKTKKPPKNDVTDGRTRDQKAYDDRMLIGGGLTFQTSPKHKSKAPKSSVKPSINAHSGENNAISHTNIDTHSSRQPQTTDESSKSQPPSKKLSPCKTPPQSRKTVEPQTRHPTDISQKSPEKCGVCKGLLPQNIDVIDAKPKSEITHHISIHDRRTELSSEELLWEQKIKDYINKNKQRNLDHRPGNKVTLPKGSHERKGSRDEIVLGIKEKERSPTEREVLDLMKRPKSDRRYTDKLSDDPSDKSIPPKSVVRPIELQSRRHRFEVENVHTSNYSTPKQSHDLKQKQQPQPLPFPQGKSNKSLSRSMDESFDSFEFHEQSLGIVDEYGRAKRNSQLLQISQDDKETLHESKTSMGQRQSSYPELRDGSNLSQVGGGSDERFSYDHFKNGVGSHMTHATPHTSLRRMPYNYEEEIVKTYKYEEREQTSLNRDEKSPRDVTSEALDTTPLKRSVRIKVNKRLVPEYSSDDVKYYYE